MTKKFQRETPITCLKIAGVSTCVSVVGGSLKMLSTGGSVDSAIAANVSMIRLIHRSYTALSGHSPKKQIPTMTSKITETLTVSWNCKNLPMF